MTNITRRHFLTTSLTAASAVTIGMRSRAAEPDPAATFAIDPTKPIIPAPSDPAQWPAFREQLARWRDGMRRQLNYNDRYYRMPTFAWGASDFACGLVMMCDELFFSPTTGEYTLDSFLDQGQREFGGYDSIVLWHAYPRIGVDQRNQVDFYRDMPGGLPGIRKLVARAHQRGVRVYINYNPWDLGTRRETMPDKTEQLDDPTLPWRYTAYSVADAATLPEIVKATDMDGIFLDTMPWAPTGLRSGLDAARDGVIFEGEMPLHLEHVHDHHGSWAQGEKFKNREIPGVLRNRWFERRHMVHLADRWNPDHTSEMHTAWLNGAGIMVWENVFGSWLGWSARDRSILRTILPIQRRFAAHFSGEGWTPLVPTEQPGVFASLWERDGIRLWTLINQTMTVVQGALLKVAVTAGEHYFDLVTGSHLSGSVDERFYTFSGSIAPRGIGCFLAAIPEKTPGDFPAFLHQQADVHQLASGDASSPTAETKLLAPVPTRPVASVPEGMVELTPATLDLTIEVRSRECGFYEGSHVKDVQQKDQYKFNCIAFHHRQEFPRLAIDKTPVTNAQFARFLTASGYRPKHMDNFLKHWVDGRPPGDKENHPVVWVDLDDARAYAKWAGKRLPTEEEWQYAAQGADGRAWPWGAKMEPGRCNDGKSDSTTPVDAFPEGRSPCGCYDLCGNVWQWTESERSDGRTRFVMIRGGSYFEAKGSGWYVTGGPRPANESTKFLLMWSGLDRCATIGFRCVVDFEK